MSRARASLLVTAGTLVAMNLSLARSGYATSLVPVAADVALAGAGLAFALTREASGGARLRDLNTAVRCPGIGGNCRNYFHPPKGELLLAVVLPDGRHGMVCRPDAQTIGQAGPVQVEIEATEIRSLASAPAAQVVEGEVIG